VTAAVLTTAHRGRWRSSAIRVYDKLLFGAERGEHVQCLGGARDTPRAEEGVGRGRQVPLPIRLVSVDAIRCWDAFDADSGKELSSLSSARPSLLAMRHVARHRADRAALEDRLAQRFDAEQHRRTECVGAAKRVQKRYLRSRDPLKIIFETPPVQATFTNPHTGTTHTAFASFRAYMFGPNEQLPALPTVEITRKLVRRLSDLRAQAGHGQPIVVSQGPNSPLRGVLPDTVTIPEQVLASLPPDALLRFAWGFGSDRGPKP
jgi:hypothetical protein